jgi:hypothetical protein
MRAKINKIAPNGMTITKPRRENCENKGAMAKTINPTRRKKCDADCAAGGETGVPDCILAF